MGDEDKAAESGNEHWQLARDVVGFQFKLALDALRDVLLSPVSIIAALAGVVLERDNPRRFYDDLLALGRRTDRWINLFGQHTDEGAEGSSDDYVRKVESFVVNEYQKGGIVRDLKDGTDQVIHRLKVKDNETRDD